MGRPAADRRKRGGSRQIGDHERNSSPRRDAMSKPFRLYICSDIHASERTWRKFLNAIRANVYKADAALIAGDLTGKALIPVVADDTGGVWTATLLGQRRTARSEEELAALERSIADVGYYAVRVSGEERAALDRDPALVRTRFHDAIARRAREWMALAAER